MSTLAGDGAVSRRMRIWGRVRIQWSSLCALGCSATCRTTSRGSSDTHGRRRERRHLRPPQRISRGSPPCVTGGDPAGPRATGTSDSWDDLRVTTTEDEPDRWAWLAEQRDEPEPPDLSHCQVTAVLVALDAEAWLPETLAALSRLRWKPTKLIAVDNGSTDSTGELLERAHRHGLIDAVVTMPEAGRLRRRRRRGSGCRLVRRCGCRGDHRREQVGGSVAVAAARRRRTGAGHPAAAARPRRHRRRRRHHRTEAGLPPPPARSRAPAERGGGHRLRHRTARARASTSARSTRGSATSRGSSWA